MRVRRPLPALARLASGAFSATARNRRLAMAAPAAIAHTRATCCGGLQHGHAAALGLVDVGCGVLRFGRRTYLAKPRAYENRSHQRPIRGRLGDPVATPSALIRQTWLQLALRESFRPGAGCVSARPRLWGRALRRPAWWRASVLAAALADMRARLAAVETAVVDRDGSTSSTSGGSVLHESCHPRAWRGLGWDLDADELRRRAVAVLAEARVADSVWDRLVPLVACAGLGSAVELWFTVVPSSRAPVSLSACCRCGALTPERWVSTRSSSGWTGPRFGGMCPAIGRGWWTPWEGVPPRDVRFLVGPRKAQRCAYPKRIKMMM